MRKINICQIDSYTYKYFLMVESPMKSKKTRNVRNLMAVLNARSASSKRLGPISFNALPILDHASAKSGDKRNASS